MPGIDVGDSVVVKPGVADPDTGSSIAGWQGRVINVEPGEKGMMLVGIVWDSVTLKQMPSSMIEKFENDGLDWSQMYLEPDDVELTQPRDSEQDAEQTKSALGAQFSWAYLGEQGQRIQRVLHGVGQEDEMGAFRAWEKYLRENLTFPFEAEITEWQERGPLRAGDRLNVHRIVMVDDSYGVIVHVNRGRQQFDVPLCDLKALDKKSPYYRITDDYAVFYANR